MRSPLSVAQLARDASPKTPRRAAAHLRALLSTVQPSRLYGTDITFYMACPLGTLPNCAVYVYCTCNVFADRVTCFVEFALLCARVTQCDDLRRYFLSFSVRLSLFSLPYSTKVTNCQRESLIQCISVSQICQMWLPHFGSIVRGHAENMSQ